MALEAVVFPQNLFAGGTWGYGFGGGELEEMVGGGRNQGEGRGVVGGVHGSWGISCFSSVVQSFQEFDVNSSSTESCTTTKEAEVGPRKRQRGRRCKNKEEVENQRMTHIAVERNRRKMMNEYLAVLRSLMPPSYVQRGDQASIVAGAINFVKELEQLLQSLEAQKQVKHQSSSTKGSSSLPFAGFFSFPQYSSCSAAIAAANTSTPGAYNTSEAVAMADIEVTMAESHVNLKVLSRRRPKQLLRMVEGLHSLRLTTLHLNVTTVDEMVLYSFNLKVEDDCRLTSVDEIATAVYQMVGMIKEEAGVI